MLWESKVHLLSRLNYREDGGGTPDIFLPYMAWRPALDEVNEKLGCACLG